jgi:hypothetical protein
MNVLRIGFPSLAIALLLGACITFDSGDDVTVSPNFSRFRPEIYAVLPFETRPAETALDQDDILDYEEDYGPYVVVGDNAAEIAQEAFEDSVSLVGGDVVVRSRVADVLSEIEFQTMSGITAADAATVGAMVNADAILVGTITQYNFYTVAVSVRALDVENGIVLWSASGYRDVWDYEDDPGVALRSLAREMMTQVGSELGS